MKQQENVMETIDIPLGDVVIGKRIRQSVGDTDSLMVSMNTVGQLQPIGLTTDNRLIFGRRRLDAAERLGWETIRATRFDTLDAAINFLRSERDENTCRLPLTPSEAVAVGRMLEELERPKAAARLAATQAKPGEKAAVQGRAILAQPCEPAEKGRTRDIVAKAIGMAHETYRQAKVVVEAAEAPDATAEIKAIAKEMDETGKVAPAYTKVTGKLARRSNPTRGDSPAMKDKEPVRVRELREAIEELLEIVKGSMNTTPIQTLRDSADRIWTAAKPFLREKP